MKNLSLLFIGCVCILNAEAFELVRGGRAAAEIALPAEPVSSVKFAAKELQKHLKLITGTELPVTVENAPRRLPNRIHLGYGAAPESKKPFAWRVKAGERDLYLHGNDVEISPGNLADPERTFVGWYVASQGTLMAVYDFLDRELGVRWFRPTDRGICAPKRETLQIGTIDRQGEPKLDKANFSQAGVSSGKLWNDRKIGERFSLDCRLWQLRHRMVDRYWFHSGHAFSTYWNRFGKAHPEFFARLHDGTRRPLAGDRDGRYITMCVSSPGLLKNIVAEYRRGYGPQGKHKAENFISVCENDTPGMCTCDGCRAWDMPEFNPRGSAYWEKKLVLDRFNRFSGFGVDEGGSYSYAKTSLSDRYARFWLEVYKELKKINPSITIMGYAYLNTVLPPRHVKLNPHILVSYVGTPFFPLTEAKMAKSRAEWDGWMKTGCTMEFRPNTTWSGGVYPLQYGERLGAEYRRILQDPRTRRVHFDSLRGEFANQGLMWYILARLTYRSDLTVKEICDEYFNCFGNAGAALRVYFDYWRDISDAVTEKEVKAWEKELGYNFMVWNNTDMCVRIFRPEHFAEGAKLLDKAAKAAVTPEEKEAVAFFRLGLEHARLTWIAGEAHLKRVLHDTFANQADFEKKRAVLLEFRKAHERSGISNMGVTTSKETSGYRSSRPRKK